MSFSVTVKDELVRVLEASRHCQLAELAGIINMTGTIQIFNDKLSITVHTEHAPLARKYFTLIKKAFNIDCDISIRKNVQLKKNRTYILALNDREVCGKMLRSLGLLNEQDGVLTVKHRIYPLIVNSICCRRSYIRGSFLGSGSVTNPEKSYHLEFVCSHKKVADELAALINSFEMDAKIVIRKKHYIVYLKEGEQIVDILNIMQAHNALLNLENIRILKDMRNNVNRFVNCETANINKVVNAAVKQVDDITYIDSLVGLSKLPPQLREVAQLRLLNTDSSLKELGEMLTPPVGKSGINHRLRKISEIAYNLRLNEHKGVSEYD